MKLFRYQLFKYAAITIFLAIFARVFYLQIIKGPELYEAAQKNQFKVKDRTFRGDIVDRLGKVLALDVSRYTLEYNPKVCNENKDKLTSKLARIITFDKKLLYKNSSQIIATNVPKATAKKIQALNSQFLNLRKTSIRFYPQNNLASHVVGYVDLYGKARKGIEAKFEEFLLKHQKKHLELSVDSRLQALTEKALVKHINKTKAKKGSVIVMNSETGEILTWAVAPSYDPNQYFKAPVATTKNWAAVDVYQPGSIFKILTVSAALESGTVSEDYKFLDNGFIKVDNWKISNHDYIPNKTKSEELSLQGLFARSSNPFAAYLALQMGAETFYKYIKAFGIGRSTGVELIGESSGILKDHRKWRKSDIASTGIGQGAISVTPLQVLSAINIVANNGTWVRPTLIKKDSSDRIQLEKLANGVNVSNERRIISAKTAKLVSNLLQESIAYNIKERYSKAGKVKGLAVAGKTGTAQKPKPGGGYYSNKTIASFVGFFELGKTKYISLVVIDDPQTDGRWGDTVAGPLFNQVAKYVKSLYSI